MAFSVIQQFFKNTYYVPRSGPSAWGQISVQYRTKFLVLSNLESIRGRQTISHKHLETIRSDQISRSVVSDSLQPHESQHARPPCPSPSSGVHSDSCPLSQWYHPAISSSVVPFSSCPQSLPESESFPMSQLFTSCGQSIGVSALASFLPKKSQGWSPSEWTAWISLQSKGLSRVFSNTTVQKHQFFGAQNNKNKKWRGQLRGSGLWWSWHFKRGSWSHSHWQGGSLAKTCRLGS